VVENGADGEWGGDQGDEGEHAVAARAVEDLSSVNPGHQLRPGEVVRAASLLLVVDELEVGQRQIRLAGAGPAVGDHLGSALGPRGEAAVVDDKVFVGSGDECGEALEQFVGREQQICGSVRNH